MADPIEQNPGLVADAEALLEEMEDDAGEGETSFLDKLRARILDDRAKAKFFLDGFHNYCRDMYQYYHNAENYVSLRKQNKFPMPVIQEDTDMFVADSRDKLFYNNEPCSMIGREDTDKNDAAVKQEMMEYQDQEGDSLYAKAGLWLRDCCLYRMCVGQVNYEERTTKRWAAVEEPMPLTDPNTGLIVFDDNGFPVPMVDDQGNTVPSGKKRWELQDRVEYRGAVTERVDPANVYFSQDKQKMQDEFPIMIQSRQTLEFFHSKPYFFNQHLLPAIRSQSGGSAEAAADFAVVEDKRRIVDQNVQSANSLKPYKYLEWQGPTDAIEAYTWLAKNRPKKYQEISAGKLYLKFDDDGAPEEMIPVEPRQKVWTIQGLVNDLVIVRFDIDPFDYGAPNIVIGFMAAEEEGLIGGSLGQKIRSIHLGSQDLIGMLLENFKQSVNAMWGIDWTRVRNKSVKINEAGAVLNTQGDPNTVIKRIPVERIAPDLYGVYELFKQTRQNAGGFQEGITGRGDRAAETLGEFEGVFAQAALRIRDYLRSFEDSFIKPMWALRNHVNSVFIDSEYAYRILGEKGYEWRKVSPGVLRAGVDFICKASSRETQKIVIVQQMLQLAKIAPLALSAGQPVRIDKIIAKLCENGFGWQKDEINEILPLLQMEDEQGIVEINKMLAENAMLTQAIIRLQSLMALGAGGQPSVESGSGNGSRPVGAASPGAPIPSPNSEGQGRASLSKQSRPDVNAQRRV